jgi:hypothetical protein
LLDDVPPIEKAKVDWTKVTAGTAGVVFACFILGIFADSYAGTGRVWTFVIGIGGPSGLVGLGIFLKLKHPASFPKFLEILEDFGTQRKQVSSNNSQTTSGGSTAAQINQGDHSTAYVVAPSGIPRADVPRIEVSNPTITYDGHLDFSIAHLGDGASIKEVRVIPWVAGKPPAPILPRLLDASLYAVHDPTPTGVRTNIHWDIARRQARRFRTVEPIYLMVPQARFFRIEVDMVDGSTGATTVGWWGNGLQQGFAWPPAFGRDPMPQSKGPPASGTTMPVNPRKSVLPLFFDEPAVPNVSFAKDHRARTLTVVQADEDLDWSELAIHGASAIPTGPVQAGDVIRGCQGSVGIVHKHTGMPLCDASFPYS